MKKIVSFILILVIALSFTSCSLGGSSMGFVNDDYSLANARFNEISQAIKNKDAAALKKVFAKNVINTGSNLDNQIKELFDFIKGDVISYNVLGGLSTDTGRNTDGSGRIYNEVFSSFKLKTKNQIYGFYIEEFTKDSANADNIGVKSIYVFKIDESNKETVKWESGFGITIDHKQE